MDIYRLKQTPHMWYNELKDVFISFCFSNCRSDTSLFIYSSNGSLIYFFVYVDDLLVTGTDDALLGHFMLVLSQQFSLEDLGSLHYFLGVEFIPIT